MSSSYFTFSQFIKWQKKIKVLDSRNQYDELQKQIHKMQLTKIVIYTTVASQWIVEKCVYHWFAQFFTTDLIAINFNKANREMHTFQFLSSTFHHTANQKWAKEKVDTQAHKSLEIYSIYTWLSSAMVIFYLVWFIYNFSHHVAQRSHSSRLEILFICACIDGVCECVVHNDYDYCYYYLI